MEETNRIYRLEEMRDEMNKSIANCNTIMAQQKRLIEVISVNAAEEFEEFINELNNQIANLETQYERLSNRVASIDVALDKAKESADTEEAISNLLYGLGVFE